MRADPETRFPGDKPGRIYNHATMKLPIFSVLSALVLWPVFSAGLQQQSSLTPEHQIARDIFRELIEINTTDTPAGNVTTAAEAMAARFRAGGFPEQDIQVLGPLPNKKNLVVRLHGGGRAKPVLFIGHLDVVQALRQDWSMDPFKFNEVDGFFYGRGTSDIKQGDAILVASFLRLKKEGWSPSRDLILALTADEEGGESNGIIRSREGDQPSFLRRRKLATRIASPCL